MTIPSNAERRDPKLTAHDIAHFRRLELTMRARPYAVTATEAADAIASLLFHVQRLSAAPQPCAVIEARHAQEASHHG